MSSLIPGFEYDIFISYRQKDNKGDRWVSEFVEALRTELESTFKEEISVYFDINPHDGLLETHDVDASLKEKLKCAVFIPIISRTYCDPNSFAWVHEFKTFIEQASTDQHGLKVKLPGGNVANRVLPVQIHDLDTEDKKLVENELDGFIRGIEFIYREPGVNRPLRANEDHPDNNLNKTFYRNQINKVANAIKAIVSGLKEPDQEGKEISDNIFEEKYPSRIKQRTKILAIALIITVLLVPGYFLIPGFFKPASKPEKSIAVLPFINLSEDQNQEFMSDGLSNDLCNHLFAIKSFSRVISFNSVIVYKKTNKKISQIAGELKVNYILEGTYRKIGDQVKITATLKEARKDKQLWQHEYDQPYKELISIQADIAIQIADQVDAFISISEKENIQKITTTNQEAYAYLQKAMNYFNSTYYYAGNMQYDSCFYFLIKAIEADSSYADPYAWKGFLTIIKGNYAGQSELQYTVWDALPNLEKAVQLDSNNGTAHLGLGIYNEWIRWDYIKAEEEFLKSLKISPNNSLFVFLYCDFLIKRGRVEEALRYCQDIPVPQYYPVYLTVISCRSSGKKAKAYESIRSLFKQYGDGASLDAGEEFQWLEDYDSSKYYFESAQKSNNTLMSTSRYQACLALVYSKTNQNDKAQIIINRIKEKDKQSVAESPDFYLGWYFSGIGKVDSAIYWLQKAYMHHSPEMIWLKEAPVFENLQKDKRYWDLYEKTGHKAYDDYMKSKKN
jgi:TolB-like protein